MSMPDAFRKLQLSDIPDVIETVLARKQAEQLSARSPLAEQVETLVQQADFFREEPPSSLPTRPATGRVGQGVRDTPPSSLLPPPSCQALARTGRPCRARPISGSEFCMSHDPDYAEQQRENVRAGGVASGKARQPLPFIDPEALNLADRTSVQAVIDAVLRLELSGKLPPSRSRVIVCLLSLAVRNFDRPGRESFYDALVAAHDPGTYTARRDALDARLDEITDRLGMDETVRRTHAIADVGSRRQEYLRANEMFAPAPPPLLKPHEVEWPNDHMLDGDD